MEVGEEAVASELQPGVVVGLVARLAPAWLGAVRCAPQLGEVCCCCRRGADGLTFFIITFTPVPCRPGSSSGFHASQNLSPMAKLIINRLSQLVSS